MNPEMSLRSFPRAANSVVGVDKIVPRLIRDGQGLELHMILLLEGVLRHETRSRVVIEAFSVSLLVTLYA